MTAREIDWMYKARVREQWRQASPTIAILYNANRAKGAEAMAWDALVPFEEKAKAATSVPLRDLLPLMMAVKPT